MGRMKTLELLVMGFICIVISQGYFSLAEQCLDRFMNLSLIQLRGSRIGQGTPAGIERMNNEIRIMTNIQFTCDAQIDSVLLGIDIRYMMNNRDKYPSIQLWRPTGVSNIQLVSEQMIVYTPANVSNTGVYQYPLTTPLNARAGDYLAISQPQRSISIVRVFTIDVQSNSSYSITHGSRMADLDQEVAGKKLVLLYPNSAQLVCITSTVTESFVKDQSLLIARTIEVSGGRQLIYPDMKFKCNGTINKWIYVGTTEKSTQLMPELQVWRLSTDTSDTYIKIGSSQVIVNETGTNSNIHELSVEPPIEFMEGDVFGLHQPIEIILFTSFILHLQEHSGPYNFRVSNNVNNALSTLNFSTMVEVDNDYPLVTMEISQQHTSIIAVSSSSVLVSSSAAAYSHNLVLTTGPSTDQFTYISKSTSMIATHRPLTSSADMYVSSPSLISITRTTMAETMASSTTATSSTPLDSAMLHSPPSAIGVNDTDTSPTPSSRPSINQLFMLIVMILAIIVLVLIVGMSTTCVLATVIVWRKKTRKIKDGNITSDNSTAMNSIDSPNEVSCDINVSYNQVHHHYMSGSKGRSQLVNDDDDDAYTTIEGTKPAAEQNLVYDTII